MVSGDFTYRMAFDVWKSQVDSFWTRASYNVVFQLAAITGFFTLLDKKNEPAILALSLASLLLTIIWFKTSQRMNDYINFYWRRLGELERDLEIPPNQQIFLLVESEGKGIPPRKIKHRYYVNAIPVIFGIIWTSLLGWSICILRAR
jgi:hypothetical protein